MIISASRRTDIPAFYSDWFINRLKENVVFIPNPRNPNRMGKATLTPENVDCIIFWTKNPIPMIDKLDAIEDMGYQFYFQFTLTPYGKDVEKNLPSKEKLIQTFINLSKKLGKHRVLWRYDPVFIDEKHTIEWHEKQFGCMCKELSSYTDRCTISFMDIYACNSKSYRSMTENEILQIAKIFSDIARKNNVSIYTCSERYDLSKFGISHAACIDAKQIEKVIGFPLEAKKDLNQRKECGCIESLDIGVYDTCPNGCTYYYGTTSMENVKRKIQMYDDKSPILTSFPKGNEIITDRTSKSRIIRQISFF